ncbi:MAG: trypsin-like peptidase domain-containing protein [Myxococcales bacterium]
MTGLLQMLSGELTALVAQVRPSVAAVEHRRGQGSGVVLAADGYVVTNAHVVRGARKDLRVRLPGLDPMEAELVGADPQTDLAVLRVPATNLPARPLADSRKLKPGQLVVAIGNPLRFEHSVSLGVVSALEQSLAGPGILMEGLVQTDAAVNPGNSGGPLVDVDGAVVGLNTAMVAWAHGIGFAVPAHTISWVAAVLIHHGEIRRPMLGVSARGEELVGAVAAEAGQSRAIRIHEVVDDTPALVAGLRQGDLVLSADAQALSTVDDLQRVMVLGGAQELKLEVLRSHRRERLSVQPQPRPRPAERAA